jgi:phosphatidylcholine synthase
MLILLILAILVFVPVKYLTFSSKVLRPLTTVVASLYGGVLIVMVVLFDKLPLFWILASLIFPAYYFGISIYLYLKGITDHHSEGKAD